jgi:2,4-didehydro-3-deoxy-L-rhamnonate hydrolase
MVWHALATYKGRDSDRTALVLDGGSYDLETVARLIAPDSLPAFGGDALALLRRWPEIADTLALLATRISAARTKVEPLASTVRFAAPFVPPRIFCAASNFVEHAKEMGTALAAKEDSEPYVFMKADSSVIGPEESVLLPDSSTKVDWEVELAAVIGTGGRDITAAAALDHVAAYTIFNDISARDQGRRTDFPFKNDWFRGKSYDTFGPLGPWLVPSALIPDPQNVGLKLDVSGVMMQDGSTNEMIFTLAEQIVYLSRILTLKPGDVIATGTPTGVGMGRGIFLKPGDVMTATISGIGSLRNPVVAR